MTVVGEAGCQIQDLVHRVMTNENLAVTIQERWYFWAGTLGIAVTVRNGLRLHLLQNSTQIEDVFERILLLWVIKHGNQATLEQLVNSFRDLQMEKIAQFLEASFLMEQQVSELQTDGSLIDGAKIEGNNKHENVIDHNVSRQEEKTKTHLTDWLKKRNYMVFLVAYIVLAPVILIPLLNYAPFQRILRKHYKNEVELVSSEETKFVGDKGCGFGTIVLALSKDEGVVVTLKKEWKQLARELEIRKIDVMDLEDDMTIGKKRTLDVVEAILENWRSGKANMATLRTLINSCKKLGLEDVAAVLETLQHGDLC